MKGVAGSHKPTVNRLEQIERTAIREAEAKALSLGWWLRRYLKRAGLSAEARTRIECNAYQRAVRRLTRLQAGECLWGKPGSLRLTREQEAPDAE